MASTGDRGRPPSATKKHLDVSRIVPRQPLKTTRALETIGELRVKVQVVIEVFPVSYNRASVSVGFF
jgi:hypothetical protein